MLLSEGVQVAMAPSMGLIDSIQHETFGLWQKRHSANGTVPVGSLGYEMEHTVKLQRSCVGTTMTGDGKERSRSFLP